MIVYSVMENKNILELLLLPHEYYKYWNSQFEFPLQNYMAPL